MAVVQQGTPDAPLDLRICSCYSSYQMVFKETVAEISHKTLSGNEVKPCIVFFGVGRIVVGGDIGCCKIFAGNASRDQELVVKRNKKIIISQSCIPVCDLEINDINIK